MHFTSFENERSASLNAKAPTPSSKKGNEGTVAPFFPNSMSGFLPGRSSPACSHDTGVMKFRNALRRDEGFRGHVLCNFNDSPKFCQALFCTHTRTRNILRNFGSRHEWCGKRNLKLHRKDETPKESRCCMRRDLWRILFHKGMLGSLRTILFLHLFLGVWKGADGLKKTHFDLYSRVRKKSCCTTTQWTVQRWG